MAALRHQGEALRQWVLNTLKLEPLQLLLPETAAVQSNTRRGKELSVSQ